MGLRPFNAPGARLALNSKRAARSSSPLAGESEVILDVSRLLSRAFHPAPTGIDRVEYTYARELLERMPDRLAFAAVHPAGGYYGRLSNSAVRQFLAFTAAKWRNLGVAEGEGRATVIRHMFATRPRPVPRPTRPRIYLQVSPHHLDDPAKVGAILRAEGARFGEAGAVGYARRARGRRGRPRAGWDSLTPTERDVVALVATGVLPGEGESAFRVEQGAEVGRPSVLHGRVEAADGAAVRCHVGGRVVRVATGEILVPPPGSARPQWAARARSSPPGSPD